MKTLFLTIISVLVIHSGVVALTPNNERSTDVLYVSAQTIESNDEIGDVTVTILEEGVVVDKFTSKRKGKFDYYFSANGYYEVVLEKPGFITKRIEINTYTYKLQNKLHDFHFYVEMDKGSENINDDIAKIYFPKNGRKFKYAKL